MKSGLSGDRNINEPLFGNFIASVNDELFILICSFPFYNKDSFIISAIGRSRLGMSKVENTLKNISKSPSLPTRNYTNFASAILTGNAASGIEIKSTNSDFASKSQSTNAVSEIQSTNAASRIQGTNAVIESQSTNVGHRKSSHKCCC